MDISKIAFKPIRIKIIQYLMVHKVATAKEIAENLNHIPRNVLYAHINLMEVIELIQVVGENKIQGTVEKIYSLNNELDFKNLF